MHRWIEHTAELELAIDASSERAVFFEALYALAELLASEPSDAQKVRRNLRLTAADRATLLAGWLEELVFLAESEGFEPLAVERLDLQADALEATVLGRLGAPPPLIKAVTYHHLTFEDTDGAYRATVVLDV